jgi:hypothetical protein
MHECPLCNRTFRNNDLIGYEITRGDFVVSWRDLHETRKAIKSGSIIDGIKRKKDVDSQMDNMVQESTDNLMHEIIMVRIFGKKPKEAEEQAIKTRIDKIFDIVLGRA